MSLYCSDKFGAYGLIGFGMVGHAGSDLEIQDLMLTCRVQGKFVEQAPLHAFGVPPTTRKRHPAA